MPRWGCVVVGGGLIGAVVARRLAEGDCRVLLVERGRVVSDPPGSHVRNSPPFRDDREGYFEAIDPLFHYFDRDVGPAQLPGAFTTSIDGGWASSGPTTARGR